MNPALFDIERFHGYPRPTSTDFMRQEFLRKLIASAQNRLADLRREPKKDEESMLRERFIIATARRELTELKNRLDFF